MTYLQGMAYELARELISSRIGNMSHAIGIEQSRPNPCRDLIADLEAQIVLLSRERERLDPGDDHQVRSTIIRYSRNGSLPEALIG